LLLEVIAGVSSSAGFTVHAIEHQAFPPTLVQSGQPSYPRELRDRVMTAIVEALAWLESQVLIMQNWEQPSSYYMLTRRGRSLVGKAKFEAYRSGRTLPLDLLPQKLGDKVYHLYLRGDYETAVFQAFKMVETAVREAGEYKDDLFGVALMREAFHPERGRLTDMMSIMPEREAMSALFSGAIGYAKNPPSHRDVAMERQDAARLIVFAAHLLGIVEIRQFIVHPGA
jgi:uncharacterized protein (TIGR02391 family)